jgi:hypothetical protein
MRRAPIVIGAGLLIGACNAILGNDDAFLVPVDAGDDAIATSDGTVPDGAPADAPLALPDGALGPDGAMPDVALRDAALDAPLDASFDGPVIPPWLPYKRVFITSLLYSSSLGGLAGADAKCDALALAAGIKESGAVHYRAWLSSTTESPGTRFAKATIPYGLVDRTLLARDYTDLTTSPIRAPINRTEDGGAPPTSMICGPDNSITYVWTDTERQGTPSLYGGNACNNWMGLGGGDPVLAVAGADGINTSNWSDSCAGPLCGSGTAALFCFEQ